MPIYPQDAQGVLSSGTGTNYLFDSPRVGDTAQFSLVVSGESPPKYDPNFTLPGVPGIAWSLNGTSWGAENAALSGLVVTAEGTTVYAKCMSAQASPVTVAIDSAGLIELPPANQAPAFTTAATVSAIGATGCTVTAVAADPDGDTLTYKVAVTTSITPPTDWSAYSNRTHAQIIAGVAVGSLTASTNYYAHVQVTDSLNDPVVSTSAQFATAAANQQPTFITPATVSSITDEGCVVTAAASDPDGDTLIYKLAITTSATPPTDWSGYSDRPHATMVSGVTVGSLTASTNYYAHVQVRDGVTTPVVSTSSQFTTAAPNQQPTFTTEATVSNITSVGCVVTAAASDPDGDTLTYQVKITTSPTILSDWSGSTVATHAEMIAGVAMSGLIAETNYYAHVRVDDGVTAWKNSTSTMFSTLAASIYWSDTFDSSIHTLANTVEHVGTDSANLTVSGGMLRYNDMASITDTGVVIFKKPIKVGMAGKLTVVGEVGSEAVNIARVALYGPAVYPGDYDVSLWTNMAIGVTIEGYNTPGGGSDAGNIYYWNTEDPSVRAWWNGTTWAVSGNYIISPVITEATEFTTTIEFTTTQFRIRHQISSLVDITTTWVNLSDIRFGNGTDLYLCLTNQSETNGYDYRYKSVTYSAS